LNTIERSDNCHKGAKAGNEMKNTKENRKNDTKIHLPQRYRKNEAIQRGIKSK
jgi:hypothetical protein